MAVSPLLFQSEDSSRRIVTSKSLAVRPISHGVAEQQSSGSTEPVPELAEKLNEELKQKYVKDRKVGEGTFAVVYLGHLKADPSSLVAIKKIKVDLNFHDGLSISAIREVKFLQELSHPNIIALYSVFSSKNQNLNLVLEYLPLGDLEILIRDAEGVRYGTADIKAWMGMLGRAVWFCHENSVLHRDIKPNNLLIAADGELKLADFGLARSFADPYRPMTHQVITRWYRPPELLYGAKFYSGAVDMWAVGLVFAELIIRTPWLKGSTDMHQIELTCQAIGTPTEENWPGVTKLPDYVKSDSQHPVRGKDYYMPMFGTVGPLGVDLLMSTLFLDPQKRASATRFLEHRWWTTDPKPTNKQDLPKKHTGPERMGEDLKRRGGEVEDRRAGGDNVARKLDFSSTR